MARKHHPPFDDDGRGVPESAWVALMMRIPTVFEAVWQLKKEHNAIIGRWDLPRRSRLAAEKKWKLSPQAEALAAAIQLEFNYSESTIKTRNHIWRAMVLYKKHRAKIINKKISS